MIFISKFDTFLESLLKKETDPINQARIKMLVYIILAHMLFAATLITAYAVQGQFFQLIRISAVMVLCTLCLAILRYANVWRGVSHVMVITLTLVVWSNLSFYVKSINVATLQYVWFACALGFFMLGLKWGWFYSSLNVIPLIIFTALDGNYYFIGAGSQKVERLTYIFIISFDFIVIIFLHYFFFKAYQRNFVRLTDAKNELNKVNEQLNNALSHLEKLSRSRMNFLSTMSHELRTPMNGVIGISNTLLLQNPREDQKENMALLKFSAENLLHLINEILDFNKLEANKLELEKVPFDLITLIKNNFAGLKYKAAEKDLDFSFEIDEGLHGKTLISDPTRLSQILSNLLDNGIKFTTSGSVGLKTTISKVEENKITVCFLIADTGIGIEPDRQTAIFEAFVQASTSTNRNYGGTGLGLPIVKKLLEMFNSELALNSDLNKGTKMYFEIEFEYKKTITVLPDEKLNKRKNISQLRVLVAEDNEINVRVIRQTLQTWGIVPTIAYNGIEVLEQLKKNEFDVILMDLIMPVMDGYETAFTIRNMDDKAKSATPIIAFSATIELDLMEKIAKAGMNDFLSKPFSPDTLFLKLSGLQAANAGREY